MNGLPGMISRAGRWLLGKDAPGDVSRQTTTSGSWADIWRTQRAPTKAQLIDAYKQTVHACSILNSQAVAAVPYRLYVTTGPNEREPRVPTRKLSREELTWLRSNKGIRARMRKAVEVSEVLEHPSLDLLEMVNRHIDGFELFELTDLYQEVVGTAYWFLPLNDVLLIPNELWILPSQLVTPIRDKKLVIKAYTYGSGKEKITLPWDQVIPFRFPNLRDPYGEGWSPARAAWESVLMIDKSHSYIAAMMDNRGRPDVVIRPKEPLDPDSAERLEKRFAKKFRKGGTGGVLVSDESVEISPLNFVSKDMEMLAYHQVSKVSIANSYGTPMSKLETKNVNRANAEAGDYQHAKNAILPRCRRMEQKLNQRFFPLWDERLFLAFDNPVPDDMKTQVLVRKVNISTGVTTINEEREKEGKEPVDWGERPWLPQALVQPLKPGEEPPKPEPTDPPPSPPGEDDDEGEGDQSPEKLVERMAVLVEYRLGSIGRDTAIKLLRDSGLTASIALDWTDEITVPSERVFHNERDALETHPQWHTDECKAAGGHRRQLPKGEELESLLKTIFRKQKASVLRAVKGLLSSISSTKEIDWTTPIDLDEWVPEMVQKAAPLIELEFRQGASDLMSRVGISDDSEDWSVTLDETRTASLGASMQFCKATNATTSMEINNALDHLRMDIANGIVDGKNTPRELTKIVSGVFDKAEKWRAKRIAVTESSRAVHGGQLLAAAKSGVVSGFKWLLSDDACPMCQRIAAEHPDGVILGDSFANSGKEGPYALTYHPPAHPSCMCTVTEILTKNEEDMDELSGAEKLRAGRLKHDDWIESLAGNEHNAFQVWIEDKDEIGVRIMRDLDKNNGKLSDEGWEIADIDTYDEMEEAYIDMKAAIKRGPLDQGNMYRGLRVSPNALKKIAEVGNVIEIDAMSSFSAARAEAEGFASPGWTDDEDNSQPLLLAVTRSAGGVSIAEFGYMGEAEMIVEKGRKFKVKDVKKVDDMTILELEEVFGE